MSSPQAAASPQQPVNLEANPSQGCPLHHGWIHAITNLMSHPLTSDTGQKLQKWALSQNIFLDHPDLVVAWDPIEFAENRNFQRYPGPDGTFNYL